MFYNNNSSGEKNNGERIPQARFLHEEQLRGWNAPQPNECKCACSLSHPQKATCLC